jgi:DnaJ-class molecular chaperone
MTAAGVRRPKLSDEVLGVARDADEEAIKEAFRRLAFKYSS